MRSDKYRAYFSDERRSNRKNSPFPFGLLRTQFLFVAAVLALTLPRAQAANWDQPVAALARQIAALTGPGPVELVLRNQSTLSADELPQIRRMLEQDFRPLGIVPGGSDSATQIRVTLSQNLQGGLWIAEVREGAATRVTMLPVRLNASPAERGGPALTLRQATIITETDPVLDAQVFSSPDEQRLVVLEPQQVLVYARKTAMPVPVGTGTPSTAPSPWQLEQTIPIPYLINFSRDMRGRIVAAQDHLFDAYLPGILCRGAANGAAITLACAGSDDPWPVTPSQKAFYDAARDYFMGVLAPGFGFRLAPFYQAAEIPRPVGSAMLLNYVDGSIALVENNQMVAVNGTNDWGSDLAAIHSPCGSGTQVLVSGSGAAASSDSLRAYEISGREAVPVSAPLQVPGVVTAIAPANSPDRAVVIVHKPDSGNYEVWSVAASCN